MVPKPAEYLLFLLVGGTASTAAFPGKNEWDQQGTGEYRYRKRSGKGLRNKKARGREIQFLLLESVALNGLSRI
jgi:hypothetical protein